MLMNTDKDRGRYTSEDAAKQVGNLYDLVLIGSARARELKRNKHVPAKGQILTALAEIEDGKIGKDYLLEHIKDTQKKRRDKW